MRLPYAPSTPPPDAAQSTRDTYSRVSARRAPRPLQALDLMLLHSAPVAEGWNSFLGAIRGGTSLPAAAVQEVAICRVAVLNDAPYEWDAHSLLACKGPGALGREGLRSLLDAEAFVGSGAGERLRALRKEVGGEGTKGGLTARQWVVVAFTDQSTRQIKVDDGIWEAVRDEFDEKQAVELVATVAAYNCVSRFLVALDVGERNGGTMEIPDQAL